MCLHSATYFQRPAVARRFAVTESRYGCAEGSLIGFLPLKLNQWYRLKKRPHLNTSVYEISVNQNHLVTVRRSGKSLTKLQYDNYFSAV